MTFLSALSRAFASVRSYRRTLRAPDRRVLVAEILPVFAQLKGPLLWVGVRRYTSAYPARLERAGSVCWTTDIDARFARYGRKGRHLTADILTVDRDFPPQTFRGVLLNGVFGFGVDDPAAQETALDAIAQVLAPGGWLLIGWNTDRTGDPRALAALHRHFEPAPLADLPARRAIPGTTHVYDLLRRRGGLT